MEGSKRSYQRSVNSVGQLDKTLPKWNVVQPHAPETADVLAESYASLNTAASSAWTGRRADAEGRTMIRWMLMMVVAIAAIAPAWGQHIVPRERTFHLATQPAQEIRVFTYTTFHRDCSPDVPPQIEFRTKPAHGTVSLRPAPSTVSVLREGAPDCTGHTYPGVAVWYVPSPDYRGPDQFDYSVITSRTLSHDTVIVDVR